MVVLYTLTTLLKTSIADSKELVITFARLSVVR